MAWEPIALALGLGLLISAGIYFIFFWPAREPSDDDQG
jgi:hypothetical protein